MEKIKSLNVKIFADGADKKAMLELNQHPLVEGFTTNPSLMRQAGVQNYEAFARDILKHIQDKPISFEVFSDDFDAMFAQAKQIASWGENVYVKIPITNTKGESSVPLIRKLSRANIKQNITALMTLDQVFDVSRTLADGPSAFISVFAGRIADTGRDPLPIMQKAVDMLFDYPHLELLWASTREILNIFQADAINCPIITVTKDIINKFNLIGKDLLTYSQETVNQFHKDATMAGFALLD